MVAVMSELLEKVKANLICTHNEDDMLIERFIAAALSYAESLMAANPADQTPQELVDLFCCEAKRRIEANFKVARKNHNRKYNKVAKLLMEGQLQWLAKDAITDIPPKYRDFAKNDYEHPETKLTKKS